MAVIAYFVGSFPTGFLIAKAKGIDIRKTGSGNIGATNAFRVLGKGAGTMVLVIDALKGFLPAFFLPILLYHGADPYPGPNYKPEQYAMVAGLFAILGHNYTCWLKFKGGKGIATSAGVLLALTPAGLGIALGTWLLIFAVSKYVSLASIAAAAVLPFGVWLSGGTRAMITLTAILGVLAIYKHKSNIQRLLAGTENRVGSSKKKEGTV